eukprot:TRINITY_DN66170_c0_g1_i1.p1 TRINITY_DN66170_c0_g1~~TRINITY_DN66170_c0_g1_i1.p1  ORF type:complete len:156 (-),score=17.01 TRINITY_DN66170_c0_g1_i1:97-564(-)
MAAIWILCLVLGILLVAWLLHRLHTSTEMVSLLRTVVGALTMMSDGVLIVDSELRIVGMDLKLAELTKSAAKDCIGRRLDSILQMGTAEDLSTGRHGAAIQTPSGRSVHVWAYVGPPCVPSLLMHCLFHESVYPRSGSKVNFSRTRAIFVCHANM